MWKVIKIAPPPPAGIYLVRRLRNLELGSHCFLVLEIIGRRGKKHHLLLSDVFLHEQEVAALLGKRVKFSRHGGGKISLV